MPRFLILFLATLLLACRAEVPAPRPNIVLISIDTLRSDHLPVYGYDGVDTPAIDAFAREATLFRHAFAHVPMTLPSHASIFTGVIPPAHGVRNNVGYALGEEPVTLAAWLGDAGYDTAGFASAYVLREATGIARGFDHWDAEVEGVGSAEIGSLSRSALETNRRALAWLDGRRAEDPFLLFVHYFEPHAPWDAPASYRAKAASDYDAEIAVADAAFGKLADALRARGVWDDSLVVLLSDHGEGLGDHGEQYHGIFVYREAIQVPLLVKAPGGTAAASVDEPVQLADVFPTIAEVVGRPAPAHLGGRSLFRRDGGERPIFAESLLPRIHFGWSALRSIVRGSHHGIEAPTPELYDLARDPAEKKNIVEEERR
ncbi:MAG: sulfatase, partial [Thermoanaerobaculia bacterium]